jgi:hypothetical protein
MGSRSSRPSPDTVPAGTGWDQDDMSFWRKDKDKEEKVTVHYLVNLTEPESPSTYTTYIA